MPPRLTNFKFVVRDNHQDRIDLEVNFDVLMAIPAAFARLDAAKWAKDLKYINSLNFFLALSTKRDFISKAMSLPRPVLVRDLWINRSDKKSNVIYGITSENSGHSHEFVLDYKGNGATQTAFHPLNAAINHKHSVQGFSIRSAKSDCYPKCVELHGAPGVAPHYHTPAYAYEERKVSIVKVNPSIVNTFDKLPRFNDGAGGVSYFIPVSAVFKDLRNNGDLSLFIISYNSQLNNEFDTPDTEYIVKKDIMRGANIITEKTVYTGDNGRPVDIASANPDGSHTTSGGIKIPAGIKFGKSIIPVREVIDMRTLQDKTEDTRRSQWHRPKREKIPYFTDVLISRDSQERARFCFGFDITSYLKNNCAYPALLNEVKMFPRLSTKVNISSLKVTKRRKDFPEDAPVIIAESKSQGNGMKLVSRSYSERKLTRKDKLGSNAPDVFIKKGAISELNFDSFSPLGIRYFAGIDESSKEDTQGKFQYTVDIEIIDPTTGILKEIVERTRILYGVFNDYHITASQNNYNNTAKKFEEEFVVRFEKDLKAKITSSLKEYARLVSFLKHSNRKDLPWEQLYRMIHPRNSSLEMIRNFLSIVEDNLHTLQRDYDSMKTGSTNKSVKNTVRAINENFGSQIRLLKVQKTFETEYDANSVKQHGQKIFNFHESSKASLASINKQDFMDRRQMEFNKYFRNIAPNLTVDGITVSASPSNEYFSPLELLFGEDRKVECSHLPKDVDELSNQNNSVFHISNYNDLEKISYARKKPVNQSNFSVQLKRRKDVESVELISEIDEKTSFKGLDTGNVLRLNQEKQRQSAVVNKIKRVATVSRMIDKNNQVVDRSYYDLRNPAGGIRVSTQCPPDNITLDSLPPQTKALIIASSAGGGETATVAEPWWLRPQENFGLFYQNFINLYKVEALVGYEKGGEGLQIKRPIFESLTDARLRDGKTYLCRLIKVDSKKLGRPNIEELEYPVYNQHFLLTPSSPTQTATGGGTRGLPPEPTTPTMTSTY